MKELESIKPLAVSIKDLEGILSLSRKSIYRLIAKGVLRPIKSIHGRNYLFNYQEVAALVKTNK
jgi:excisionase family DNA binding protein